MDGSKERNAVSRLAGVLGVLGTLTCVVTMVLVAVGVIGVGAASTGASSSMPGMDSHTTVDMSEPGGIEGFLIREGPTILVVSIAVVALAFAVRRPMAAIPVLLAGGLLYWGMYEQDDMGLMYATIAVGLLAWSAAYLWVRGWPSWRSPSQAAR